jgi:anhydro-N-acetylmuramic acid kinase
MVIDALVAEYSRGKRRFDKDGRLAARGRVNKELLEQLLAEPYYRKHPPKTAGREQYGRPFVEKLLATKLPLVDLIATATALTSSTIALAVSRLVPMRVDELIVSGGGARNPQVMGYLAALLPDVSILASSDFGIDIDAKEAIAFAILGYETWRRRPTNLPSATGARRPVVLGKITP